MLTWHLDCYFDLIFCDLAACFSALSKLQAAIVTIVSDCKSRGVAFAVLYYSQLIVVDRRTGSEAVPLQACTTRWDVCHNRRALAWYRVPNVPGFSQVTHDHDGKAVTAPIHLSR